MPKIEIEKIWLEKQLPTTYTEQEFINVLSIAKAELDSPFENSIVKIEHNDTNRPDLWTPYGLVRQIRQYCENKQYIYDFLPVLSQYEKKSTPDIIVDSSLYTVRPYIGAFIARGNLDETHLAMLIMMQEKLCQSFGQERKLVSIGIYRNDALQYPLQYTTALPQEAQFIPLDSDTVQTLTEIIETHQKGIEYGHLLAEYTKYPLLCDAHDKILSMPPIINSNQYGNVQVGDNNLLIEVTGLHMEMMYTVLSIFACDMADMGFHIEPLEITYSYETPFGHSVISPCIFQKPQVLHVNHARSLLGIDIDTALLAHYLQKTGTIIEPQNENELFLCYSAPYRNDFLHEVDVIEDILIGYGLDTIKPAMPHSFTHGSLLPIEKISRTLKQNIIGLGYQEVMNNYLLSMHDAVYKMHPQYQKHETSQDYSALYDNTIVQIANPISENYKVIRNSIVPSLLQIEESSGHAHYPHYMFEIGKIVSKKHNDYNTSTVMCLLASNSDSDFSVMASHISVLLYYLGYDYILEPYTHISCIKGRVAQIISHNIPIGIIGEIHPAILHNWNITTPCVFGELFLDALL